MANSFTRFRAYKLDDKGASYSYVVDTNFTLIEARYNDVNKPNILKEMSIAGCRSITKLHITSWDTDHCRQNELERILAELKPKYIEMPGYDPDGQESKECKKRINNYINGSNIASGTEFTPQCISNLTIAEGKKYSDVIYNPYTISTVHNDNSTVKLFRKGRFTILSLGDCESSEIARRLIQSSIAKTEVDVLIVAHHGANNGFTTGEFLDAISPSVAVCCCNYGNQYGHVDPNIRALFNRRNIPLYTTKTGDVVVMCGSDNNAVAFDLMTDNNSLRDKVVFRPKMLIE